MKLLKLFGLPYLFLLAFGMLVFRYGFLNPQSGVVTALNEWQYGILVLACLCVAAGGIFINNVFGFGKDNTTHISEAKGYNIYMALTLAGVGMGYYIANFINKPLFTGIFIAAAALLYIYSTSLKQTPVLSNIIIACVAALPLIAIGVFNLYPLLNDYNRPVLATLFDLLLDYALFTFLITFLLTFINDLANTDADYNEGLTTLPIALGRARTIKIVLVLALVPIGLLLYYCQQYIIGLTLALGYALLFILAPLVYFAVKLWSAATSKDFKHLETVLKLVLFLTIISVAVITFNIDYNAKG